VSFLTSFRRDTFQREMSDCTTVSFRSLSLAQITAMQLLPISQNVLKSGQAGDKSPFHSLTWFLRRTRGPLLLLSLLTVSDTPNTF